jgi:competence protein ComEC
VRLFVLAFIAGTCALQQAAQLPEPPWALAGLAVLLAARLIPIAALRAVLLVASGAAIGYGAAALRAEARLSDALPLAWEWRDAEIVGVIAGLPQPGEKGTRFLLDVEEVRTPQAHVPRTVALTWYAERPKAAVEAIPPPRLEAGERWRLVVRLKRPRGLANPHGFDLEPWALERGIRATGYVRTPDDAQRLDARVEGWQYTLHRWRGAIRDRMKADLGDARLAGVLVALAIGDQDAIAPADWEVFWRTGVGHLVSISGLHITMLAALAFTVAFFAWVRIPGCALRWPARKVAILAGVATALAYTLMTGCAVPAQRTLVMLAVIAGCVLADRHGSASRVLALAAFAVALFDPWAVLSPGFWLSFGAVASIFYVMALRTGTQGRLRGAILEQLAVTVIMVPMLMALFQEVSLVSPVANAFAIPVVSLVVVPLALAGAFLPLGFLLGAAHVLLLLVMAPLEWLAALPLAMLESHAPMPWTVAAAVFGAMWLLAPRGVPLRSCGLAWMAPLFVVVPPSPGYGAAWLDVLDVGQGLAVVVRTQHHALVYDAGPTWSAESDSGVRLVVPFLRGEGVGRLDGLVISHRDDDHYGGAASVAKSRRPEWLLSSLPPDDELHVAVGRSIRCEAGYRWQWDGVPFEVVHPGAAIYGEERGKRRRKENDRGCVLRLSTAAASALLTGDIEARSEAEMLGRSATLRSDVLVIPHHGSKTSSTAEFLDAVAPRWGLLSLGHRNRFRHPNEAVVARYGDRGVALRRTDAEGALHVELPAEFGGPIAIEGYAARARYWSERRGGAT